MAGGKETPRQKMIGMMYLVLTALLALNVSKEIINAFVKLDDKLMEGNRILISKSDGIMAEFDRAMALPQNKAIVKPWQEKAYVVRSMAYSTDKFIQIDCKNRMLKDLEKVDYLAADDATQKINVVKPLMEVQTKDDYDVATRLFGGAAGTDGFKMGQTIRDSLHSYRDRLLSFVTVYESNGKNYKFNPENVKDTSKEAMDAELVNVFPDDHDRVRSIYKMLTTPDKLKDFEAEVDWQLGTFDHAPVVAAAALFTAISNDIRAAEAQALEIIASRVKVPTFNFNKIDPLAFAPSGYLNVGDTMNVSVMIAAYDSTERPVIKYVVNDSSKLASEAIEITGGVPIKATAPGEYTLYGTIGVKEKGIVKWKPWKYKYEVGEPMGVVSNEDLTVIYAGYDHTFSASASGYPQEKISLALPGVNVNPKGGGKFSVKAPVQMQGKAVQSSISVKGSNKTFQGPKFIVKQLPKPSSYFGSIPGSESNITKAQLNANMAVGVRAGYDPSVPLDPSKVSFRVTGFEMVVNVGGNIVRKTANSGQLTPDMKQTMNALRPGMSVSFASIKAVGPAGEVRVSPLVFIIK